jgi:hypothetical protein
MTIKNKKSEPITLDEFCFKVGFNPDLREAVKTEGNLTLFLAFRPDMGEKADRLKVKRGWRSDGSALDRPIISTGNAWWVSTPVPPRTNHPSQT